MADTEPVVYAQQINMPYTYTAGRVQAAFLRALAEGRIIGSRAADGRVLVPARPHAADGSATDGLVDVADVGEVRGWTVHHHEGEERIFATIRLDGADTDLLHLLDVPAEDVREGLRVRARWAANRVSEITALEAFEPEG